MKKTQNNNPRSLSSWLILLILFALFLLGLIFIGIAQEESDGILFQSIDSRLIDTMIIVLIFLLLALVGLMISLAVSLSHSCHASSISKNQDKPMENSTHDLKGKNHEEK